MFKMRSLVLVAGTAILAPAVHAGVACNAKAGPCDEPNGTPGCDDVKCCLTICGVDPFCCEVEWDQMCVEQVALLCEICGPGSGDCFEDNGSPGCNDVACCEAVCIQDPFCCDTSWDFICAGIAQEVCGGGPKPACGPEAGSCDEANGTPGCNDIACCELICSLDPFCCLVEWDGQCVLQAEELCGEVPPPCGPRAGPCDVPNQSPGCDDVACCKLVCALDAFCCNVEWDQICVNLAAEQCTPQCTCPGDINGDGAVGASDLAAVLGSWSTPGAGDPCSTDLDENGVVDASDLAALLSAWGSCAAPVCGPGAGACGEPNGTPGCEDVACCQLICGLDSFCCDTEWDQICADAAASLCSN